MLKTFISLEAERLVFLFPYLEKKQVKFAFSDNIIFIWIHHLHRGTMLTPQKETKRKQDHPSKHCA